MAPETSNPTYLPTYLPYQAALPPTSAQPCRMRLCGANIFFWGSHNDRWLAANRLNDIDWLAMAADTRSLGEQPLHT